MQVESPGAFQHGTVQRMQFDQIVLDHIKNLSPAVTARPE